MKPRFPHLPCVLFLLQCAIAWQIIEWASVRAIDALWPIAVALAGILLLVAVGCWMADAIDRWSSAKTEWEFNQRRINPMAFHIRE